MPSAPVEQAAVWVVEHHEVLTFVFNHYGKIFTGLTMLLYLFCCIANAMHWAFYNPRACLFIFSCMVFISLVLIGLYPTMI